MQKNIYSSFALVAVLLNLFITNCTSAQTVLTESFDGNTFLPAGWTSVPVGAPTNAWTRSTAGTFPTTGTYSGAGMARYNSRTSAAGTIQTIATPSFSLTGIGANTAHVSLWIYRNDTLPTVYDTLNIMVNSALDTTGAAIIGTLARSRQIPLPDTQATSGWYQYTFDIPQTFNGPVNYILLRGVTRSGGGTGYRIFIDELTWDSYPTLCNGMPAAGTISSSDTLLCNGGGTATLQLTGLTPGFSGISYQWQSSPTPGGPYTDFGNGTTTQSTGPITATTYYRCKSTCTATNDSTFTPELEVAISTLPLPVITVSPAAADHCAGSPPVLLVANGGSQYQWTPANSLTFGQTSDSAFANPVFSTTYLITGFDNNGCHDTVSVRVTNRGVPTVSVTPLNSSICPGDSVVLNATSTGIGGGGGATTVSYTWNPGGFTGNSITVHPLTSTSYVVTGITNFGCTNDNSVDTANITVNIPPAASFTYSTIGDSTSFINTSSGATSYFWDFGSGYTSTAQDPVFTFGGSGSYPVTLVATGACSDTTTTTVTVLLTTISTIASKNSNIAPNPAFDFTRLQLTDKVDMIELFDITGNRVADFQTLYPGKENSILLDVHHIKTGVYFIRLTSGDKSTNIRLIKN